MHECTRRARMHSRKRFPFCTLATSTVRLPRGRNANVVESASAICANMANSLVCMNALEEHECTREDASLFVLYPRQMCVCPEGMYVVISLNP